MADGRQPAPGLYYQASPSSTLPTFLEAVVPTLLHRLAVNAVAHPGYALPILAVTLLGAGISWGLGKYINTLSARAWQDVITAITQDKPLEFRQSLEIR